MPTGKYFYILSKMNGLALDIQGGSADPGTRVVLWDKKDEDDADNQLFFLDPCNGCIRTKLDPNMVLDFDEDDNALKIEEFDEKDDQQWTIVDERVANRVEPEKVFDVAMGDDEAGEAGSRICKWDWHEADNQMWEFEHCAAKFFFIKSQMHGKVIDIPNADASEGAKPVMWDQGDGEDHQLWYEDRTGSIRAKLNDFYLDASKGDSLRMQPKEVGNDEQKWYLVENKLVSLADTGQVVDIKKKDEDNGTKLCKYRYKGNDNQHWEFDYVD